MTNQFQWEKAVEIAIEAHKDQMYGNLPYLYHLVEVDNLVTNVYARPYMDYCEQFAVIPGDEMDNLRAVAFLHDVLEDTDMDTGDLFQAGIDIEVIEAVCALTKRQGQSYEDYIATVLDNPLATKVKLCDTSANLMNSCKEGNTKRINKYTKQIQLLGGFK
jgi:(p)ppGpp synthase/HD superfamily hydrolase